MILHTKQTGVYENDVAAHGCTGTDPQAGFNLHRRLAIQRRLPRDSAGNLMGMVIAASTDYTTANETNFLQLIDHASTVGAEAWWLDAGWFKGGFPWGTGK